MAARGNNKYYYYIKGVNKKNLLHLEKFVGI